MSIPIGSQLKMLEKTLNESKCACGKSYKWLCYNTGKCGACLIESRKIIERRKNG